MSWLDDAVIYEIYPQSFADSNGDGIGDLQGVVDHLDHLAWLGVNTIWFNPCFASPFRDAGYDVEDYLQIAPRYGSNADLVALCAAAQRAGHPGAARPRRRAHVGGAPVVRRGVGPRGRGRGPRRPVHLVRGRAGRQRPGRGLGPLARAPAGLVPQELLRRAAGAQLRLRPPGRRRAVAPAPRRGRAAGQPRGAARGDGLLAGPRRRRVPGRHGVLAGQGRPGPQRDLGAVARAVRVAARGVPRRGPAAGERPPGAGRPGPALGLRRRLLPRHPPRALGAVQQRGRGHAVVAARPRALLLRGRGPRRARPRWGRSSTCGTPTSRPTARTGGSCWPPPTTTSPGWPAATGRPSSCRRRTRSC